MTNTSQNCHLISSKIYIQVSSLRWLLPSFYQVSNQIQKPSKKNVTLLEILLAQLIHSSLSSKDKGENNNNIHTMNLAFKIKHGLT